MGHVPSTTAQSRRSPLRWLGTSTSIIPGVSTTTECTHCLKVAYFCKIASARDFQQCGMCHQQRLKTACTYAQSDQSLCSSLEYSMKVKLLTERLLEFLNIKGGCTYWSECILVKLLEISCHRSIHEFLYFKF